MFIRNHHNTVIILQLKINNNKKSRDITLPTKVNIVKAMVFPVVI